MLQNINDRNKQNAQKSTGPTTDAGKARSSQNSLLHGMYAKAAMLPCEDREEYKNFLDKGVATLKPRDFIQNEIATLIVDNYWRMRRYRVMETNQLARLGKIGSWVREGEEEQAWDLVRAWEDDCEKSKSLEKLGRHEQRVLNGTHKMFKQLKQLQREPQEPDQDEQAPEQEQEAESGFVPTTRKPAPKTTPETPENDPKTAEITPAKASDKPIGTDEEAA